MSEILEDPFNELNDLDEKLEAAKDAQQVEEDEVEFGSNGAAKKYDGPTRGKYYVVNIVAECLNKRELNNLIEKNRQLPEGAKIIRGKEIQYKAVKIIKYEFGE